MEASAAAADDPHFPIYISSDEDDGRAFLAASHSAEEIQIQQVILLSLDHQDESLFKPEAHQETNVGAGSFISIEERDNGKGKKPWNDVLQEPDQCSRGATTSSDFYCTICMETVHTRETFFIAGCTHGFCVRVSQYVAAKVEENVLSIGCPDPGCKDGALHPEACRDVIPSQLFQRWGAALCDSALGPLKFYCPFKDCSALLVDDPGDGEAAITSAECPHCHRMFCAQCKVPWHDGVDCAEFQRLGNDERGREDLLLRKVAQESKWQRCPKCKMYVERAEGCVFIICRYVLHFLHTNTYLDRVQTIRYVSNLQVWALFLLPLRIPNVEGQPSLQKVQAYKVLI